MSSLAEIYSLDLLLFDYRAKVLQQLEKLCGSASQKDDVKFNSALF